MRLREREVERRSTGEQRSRVREALVSSVRGAVLGEQCEREHR